MFKHFARVITNEMMITPLWRFQICWNRYRLNKLCWGVKILRHCGAGYVNGWTAYLYFTYPRDFYRGANIGRRFFIGVTRNANIVPWVPS
jgi:hypothetical protein